MAPRPDLGPAPYLGYTGTRIERAAARRTDDAAIGKLFADRRAGFYLMGGELVLMKKTGEVQDLVYSPLFSAGEAQASVSVAYGWRVEELDEGPDGVMAHVRQADTGATRRVRGHHRPQVAWHVQQARSR